MKPTRETHKQVIVMRTDLNMGLGKMIGQGAHAAMKVFLDRAPTLSPLEIPQLTRTWLGIELTGATEPWLHGLFTKIVVGVGSESELLELYEKAKGLKLLTALVTDSGKTVFKCPTNICIAIGPDENAKIDAVTCRLKLLR